MLQRNNVHTRECSRKGCLKTFSSRCTWNKRYCSQECRSLARRVELPTRMCACKGCGKSFLVRVHNKKFCSPKCFGAINRRRYYGTEAAYPGRSTATVGAIGELRVCVDLMGRGFDVFKAVSPSCPCDLAVLCNGELAQFEVRTGYRSHVTGKSWSHAPKDCKADVFAIVYKDGIEYRPLKEWIKCKAIWMTLFSTESKDSIST